MLYALTGITMIQTFVNHVYRNALQNRFVLNVQMAISFLEALVSRAALMVSI